MDFSEDMSLCPLSKRVPELGDNGIHGEADYPQTKRARLDEHLVSASSSNSGTATPCDFLGMEHQHPVLQQDRRRSELPLPHTQATRECTFAIDYTEKITTSHSGDRAFFFFLLNIYSVFLFLPFFPVSDYLSRCKNRISRTATASASTDSLTFTPT